jgi:hypothetical protein
MVGGEVLDDRERVVPGIDSAFEEGHAVSTLPFTKFGYERYARGTPTHVNHSRRGGLHAPTVQCLGIGACRDEVM